MSKIASAHVDIHPKVTGLKKLRKQTKRVEKAARKLEKEVNELASLEVNIKVNLDGPQTRTHKRDTCSSQQ